MNYFIYLVFVQLLSYSFCAYPISTTVKEKILEAIVDYYNDLPNQIYTIIEASLKHGVQQVDENTYRTEVNLIISAPRPDVTKVLECDVTLEDSRNNNNRLTVVNHDCQEQAKRTSDAKDNFRAKRALQAGDGEELEPIAVGGETLRDPTDIKYTLLAEESLQKYLKDSRIWQSHKVIRVKRVTTQVVAGSLTRIEFVALNSQDSNIMICHSKIWEQPWLNKKDINVSCQNDNRRVERSLPGGIFPEDPTDPTYKVLAEESLRKYLKDSGKVEPHRVVKVNSVTTQVVSGSMTRIDFVASDNQDSNKMMCHTEIWEQPWLGNKDINVSCQSYTKRVKRSPHTLGGLVNKDPTDPKYKVLAEESLRKYVKDSGKVEPYRVFKVQRVTTQVVAGLSTRIDFVASNTQDSNTMVCHSEIWEQPWINKKDIKVFCENFLYSPIVNRRVVEALPGGIFPEDPTDPTYKVLAEESLRKYLKDSGKVEPHRVVKVNSVTSQVVSGSMTRIDFVASDSQDSNKMMCHSEIWEQPWLGNKDINVSCQNYIKRVKRSPHTLGGLVNEDPTDPKYKVLAEESLRKYVKDSGKVEPYRVFKVQRVTTQVVAGLLTRIDFVASNSHDSNTMACHSEIWEQPWINKKDINVSCENFLYSPIVNRRVEEALPGGIFPEDPTDPTYKVLAEESLRKYLKDSGKVEPHRVVKVNSVTSQVVSGSMTRIDFVASDSQDSNKMMCHSEIWEQPWLGNKDINVSCQNYIKRVKRSPHTLGGLVNEDPTDPKYKVLAEESLRKYVKDSGKVEPYRVFKVQRVTTQVVAGLLTRIDFVASNSHDSNTMACHSEIWEQPWINKKDINVSCQYFLHFPIVNRRVEKILPGGIFPEDPTDPKYKALADESLRKYLKDSGKVEPYRVVKVNSVTSQVVSGYLTRINFVASDSLDLNTMICYSEIWEQSWLNKKDIKVSC